MLEFPVAIKDITKFENENNVSINVYGLEETKYEEYHNDYNNIYKNLPTKGDTKINNNEESTKKSGNGIIYPLEVCKKRDP